MRVPKCFAIWHRGQFGQGRALAGGFRVFGQGGFDHVAQPLPFGTQLSADDVLQDIYPGRTMCCWFSKTMCSGSTKAGVTSRRELSGLEA
jgi:hypothetical protein